jgi:hypothetical protein
MKLTVLGTDYITVNEENLKDEKLLSIGRVHLIEFAFAEPTKDKIEAVFSLYPKTNRFVVVDNVRIYNAVLKETAKKYYVMNKKDMGLITFFRKNNKVLLDTTVLSDCERAFILSSLTDILKNVEVIKLFKDDFEKHKDVLMTWDGNVILV